MNVHVTSSYRYSRTPDGRVWTGDTYTYDFWRRYLGPFDDVVVVGRVQDVDFVPESWRLASGPSVTFSCVPYYVGPKSYLMRSGHIRRVVKSIEIETGAVILRGLDAFTGHLINRLRDDHQPYGLEIIGDPNDAYAAGAVRHPLRPLFRELAVRDLRTLAANASAVAYVSTLRLPDRYPASARAFTTEYSSIELQESHIVECPRRYSASGSVCRIITVGSLAQPYKGVDVLIDAVAALNSHGRRVELIVVGDGRYRAELEGRAHRLGIAEAVSFLGQLPAGAAIRDQLDASDLFVLASRTEGLPRAMIEAMARALPCVGTDVGGIPELLASENMVAPNDPGTLATLVQNVLADPPRMTRMSVTSLETAKRYSARLLQSRRTAMYEHVRGETEAWHRTRRR